MSDLPNFDEGAFRPTDLSKLHGPRSTHPSRVLLLHGSLRAVSYSRLLTFEAERLLERLGCETLVFDPAGLPLPDGDPVDHPKVRELRELSLWSEAQVWTSPERHGAVRYTAPGPLPFRFNK